MTDILDRPVPRDVIAQILPESYAPQTTIDELGEGRKVGCIRHIKRAEVSIFEAMLVECKYKFTTLLSEEEDDVYILFFTNPEDDDVREALLLEQRELGMMEPPLSINEHLKLATAYGVPEELQEQFKSRVLLALRELGEELGDGVAGEELACPKCGSRTIDHVGGQEEMCRDCTFCAQTDAFRLAASDDADTVYDDEGEDYIHYYGDETFPSTAMFDD